jgi:hypothetical protein
LRERGKVSMDVDTGILWEKEARRRSKCLLMPQSEAAEETMSTPPNGTWDIINR